MTTARIRTSLASAPSAWTEAERAERLARYERELWEIFEAIIIRRSDPGMAVVVDAIAQTRFGKREARP